MIILSIGNTCLLGQIKQTASVSVRLYLIITLFVKVKVYINNAIFDGDFPLVDDYKVRKTVENAL